MIIHAILFFVYIIEFVQDKYTNTERAVGKAVLVETINDKCAQVRRKLKNKI